MSAWSPHLPLEVISWGLTAALRVGGGVADFDLPLPEPGLFYLGSPTTPSPSVLDPIAGMGLGQDNCQ